MALLRKFAKWLCVLVLLVVVAVLVLVWPVLGVNPFEGDVDHLWELVSNDVDFFVRLPGTRLLDEPLVRGLEQEAGFALVADLREALREGVVELEAQLKNDFIDIDLNRDFLAKEMAFAGQIRADFSQLPPKVDNFIALARVAWYGRFVSALKRGFVRDRVQDGDRIDVEKGYYLKVHLRSDAADRLNTFRSQIPREEPDVLFIGRIMDVIIVSDRAEWVVDAIRGRSKTLPADPYFETEFIRAVEQAGAGGRSIDIFMRQWLATSIMSHHGRDEDDGPLTGIRKILPLPLIGDITTLIQPDAQGLGLRFSNDPPGDGFRNVNKDYVAQLYEREKSDLELDLSESGIGRFIPTERVVAAGVLHAGADELAGLILAVMPIDERQLLEDNLVDKGYRNGFERLLRSELLKDIGEEHLLIVHRPVEFKNPPLTHEDPIDGPDLPEPQFSYTILSRVASGVTPDKVRQTVFKNLKYLGLNSMGVHKDGQFHLATPIEDVGDLELVKPAYGVLPGNVPYVFFSTNVAAAEAVFRAALNPETRLIEDAGAQTAIDHLFRQAPRDGTLAFLVRGAAFGRHLADQVRQVAYMKLDPQSEAGKIEDRYIAAGWKKGSNKLFRKVEEEKDRYMAQNYPSAREDYLRSLEWYETLDTIAIACTLGAGPKKQVRAFAYAHFRSSDIGE